MFQCDEVSRWSPAAPHTRGCVLTDARPCVACRVQLKQVGLGSHLSLDIFLIMYKILLMHPFRQKKMYLLFCFLLVALSHTHCALNSLAIMISEHHLSFGLFIRLPRTVVKSIRVTVTQSAYCRDKQTGLIQPKQHY